MAERNSIDLIQGSQDLSSSFFNHYAFHAAPWFIMDAEGRYLAHSCSIGNIFRTELHRFNGRTDEDLGVFSRSYRRRNRKIRLLSLKKRMRVITLEINFFFKETHYTPLIYITEPFGFRDGYYTITRVIDVSALRRFSFLSYHEFFNKKDLTDSVLEKPIKEFSDIDPTIVLSESQWEALWLCLIGYSYRDISQITGRNLKNTAEFINRSFRLLNVHTLKNFLYIAGLYGWERFVPRTFQRKDVTKILQIVSMQMNTV